jgi:hypothetical protein
MLTIEVQTRLLLLWGNLMNIKLLVGSSLLLGCLMSANAFAQSAQTCSVTRQNGDGVVFYVPSGGDGKYNLLGWGNGTGGGANTYRGALTAAAQRCVLVAAATTGNSGSGVDVQNAVSQARSRFSNILNPDLKICTSGHQQGGGGSFNAANLIGSAVSCVIAVQPDTVFTVRILRPVAADVDVTCIFSTGDTLSGAQPNNSNNCRRNATIYREVSTAGTGFTITSGTGGQVGAAMRAQIDRLLR